MEQGNATEREGGDEKERRQQFISEGFRPLGKERETDKQIQREKEAERESNLFPTETEKDIEEMRQGN